MMIPDFTEEGHLPAGNHKAKAIEFVERFTKYKDRQHFSELLLGLIDYARSSHAVSILFGGSFISARPQPNDIDCVILFNKGEMIPTVRPTLVEGSGSADIYFASADNPDIVASFRKLFSISKSGENVGTVELELGSGTLSFDTFSEASLEMLALARRFYGHRHTVHVRPRRKVLIPIHGILTHAAWYADASLLGSLNGWVVAPFGYGYQNPSIFLRREQRRLIVDQFRDHLIDVCQLCETDCISVIAHSFGTYIAMNYIFCFNDPPTRFDSLIITGAIIDENLELSRLYGKVGHILNEIAPNDEWVDWAKRANFAQDELFGSAGKNGFTGSSERLVEYRSQIFSHTNVIKRDVIKSRWMPTLEANVGAVERDRREIGLK